MREACSSSGVLGGPEGDSSEGVIAAAQIVFSNQHGDACLAWLSVELEKAGVPCSPTEWRGYGAVVPQLLVPTAPVPLTVQIDADPAYVPDEIAELAEDAKPVLSVQLHETLARCDARLDIMSTTAPTTTETESAITVVADTDLDPKQPEVERVLLVLSAITVGFIVDCVHGRLRAPAGREWMPL